MQDLLAQQAEPEHGANKVERHSLDRETQQTLEEARTVVPGIQALFGFQLIVAFHPTFERLEWVLRGMHLVALIAVALSIALIMAPAAYHRIAERGQVSRFFVELASRLITLALVPLMLAISLDVFLICQVVLQDYAWSLTISAALLLVFAGAWFAYPLFKRAQATRQH